MTVAHLFRLVAGLLIALLSIFMLLSLVPNQSAFGTFPGENGKIAFASEREGSFYEIYVMNGEDGSNVTRLTNNPQDADVDPRWSSDGTKIAFASGFREFGNGEIFVMNADGSNPIRLTNNYALDEQPSWSPDSKKIAFMSSRVGGYEIFVMNADGSNPIRLTNDLFTDSQPRWSPDGKKIAFGSNRGGCCEIFVMNAGEGSEQTRLTNNNALSGFSDWGPAPSSPPPEEDTTPPTVKVPEDMVVEANSIEGAQVTYTVTAQDNVDGTATLQEDGTTITQDDIGGNITISCHPPSGSVFPIGDTEVQCSAIDEAGNTWTESFTVTVNPPPSPPPSPLEQAIDKLISTIQNLDNVPQSVKTSLTAVLKGISDILSDNNPNNNESACGKLGAFINQVNANERRDTLTQNQGNVLKTQAEDIIRNEEFLFCSQNGP
jgi:hypothetical protein